MSFSPRITVCLLIIAVSCTLVIFGSNVVLSLLTISASKLTVDLSKSNGWSNITLTVISNPLNSFAWLVTSDFIWLSSISTAHSLSLQDFVKYFPTAPSHSPQSLGQMHSFSLLSHLKLPQQSGTAVSTHFLFSHPTLKHAFVSQSELLLHSPQPLIKNIANIATAIIIKYFTFILNTSLDCDNIYSYGY